MRALLLLCLASCGFQPVGDLPDAERHRDAEPVDIGTTAPDAGARTRDATPTAPDAAPPRDPPDAGGPPGALRATPPDEMNFQWQGQQRVLDGAPCGRVAMAVGATAVCYAHHDGLMRCAGRIHDVHFGSTFAPTAEARVDQILISRSIGFAEGVAEGVCVHKADGTAACLGNYNTQGQFGTGSMAAVSQFTRWGTQSNLVALATGTWDQLCALDDTGGVWCAGYSFTTTPTLQPNRSASNRMYIDEFGQVIVDDATVFRVSNGRSNCRIQDRGLVCNDVTFGDSRRIVDGFTFGPSQQACWLDSAGRVYCTTGPKFTRETVLAIAADYDAHGLCAVYADGSLWCLGDNPEGRFGVDLATTPELIVETEVQPPGSVDIGCR